jgi:hypothetical protein
MSRWDHRWSRCCVAGAGGLCGKPVSKPMVGFLGMCDEHRSHGVCCKCGHFWLESHTTGRVESLDGMTHTAFACARRALGADDTTPKGEDLTS